MTGERRARPSGAPRVGAAGEAEILAAVAQTITASLDLGTVLRGVAEGARSLCSGDVAAVALREGETLVFRSWAGTNAPPPAAIRIPPGQGLAGRVLAEGRPIRTASSREDPASSPDLHAAAPLEGAIAQMAVPVRAGAHVGGVLLVLRRRAQAFTDTDEKILTRLADQAALALQNARLREAAVRRADEMEALLKASRAIQSSLDLPQRLRAIVEQAAAISGAPIVRLFLLEEGDQLLRCRVGVGFPLDQERDLTIPVGESLSGQVAATGEPLAVPDTRQDPRTYFPAHVDKYGVVSYLGLPVKFQDRLFGVLVFNTPAPRTYSAEEITFLGAFAQQAAVAIQNARLYDAAQRELSERRQAEEALAARTRHLEAIRAVTAEITRELDLARLLELIIQRAVELVGAGDGAIRLWDEAEEILVPQAMTGSAAAREVPPLRLGEGAAGAAAERRAGLIVNDFRSSPYAIPLITEGSSHTAVLAEPLLYRDRLVGAISIVRYPGMRAFTEDDRHLLSLFATQAAIAIENARLYEAAQRELAERTRAEDSLRAHQNRLEALLQGSLELARIQPLERLVGGLGAACARLLHADGGDVRIVEGDDLVKIVAWGDYQAVGSPVRLPMGQGLSGVMAARREPLIVDNLAEEAHLPPPVREAMRRLGHRAWLGVPVEIGDRLLGTLNMWSRAHFSPEDIAVATAFAAQVAIALENARLYAELRESFEHLQRAQSTLVQGEKLRALGQMAAGIAHDLNNMLAAILGQAELIRLHTTDPAVQNALEILDTAASDGAQVVRRLQGFGRQKAEGPLVPCDLASLVREALALTRPRWRDEAQRENRLIQVRTTLDDLPPILGEPAAIREAMTNLILNAVDAMPAGGSLVVAGHPEKAPGSSAGPSQVVLTLKDTGIGMSEEVRRQIFDPFFTTKGFKGTGLGLAMVYGILQRHGGTIEVDSTPGQGATFTLRFPVAAGQALAPPAAPPAGGAAARLLIIDDEAIVRQSIADLLRAVGHQVIEAESGREGLELLAQTPLDLVLTDLGMPGMSGWEVARQTKAAHPRLPVVLLTGWGQHLPEAPAAQSCVDQVLTKPVRLEELRRVVARLTSDPDAP